MADDRRAGPVVAVTAQRMAVEIGGHVQGVGFRWWARRQAEALGITGWVMNANEERAVELVAEGPPEALAELERRLRSGPSGARVESFRATRGPATGEFEHFDIVRS